MAKNKLYILLFSACMAGYIWVIYTYSLHSSSKIDDTDVCMFKYLTHIPCPSCGSTRSVLSLMHGDIYSAFLLNPFGLIIITLMVILPIWLTYDLMTGKSSLFSFYNRIELMLQQKEVAIPAILLVICNWIWNIYKGL